MTHIRLRRGPQQLWTDRNPVLRQGEAGVEEDTGRMKIGDGVLPWTDLPYFGAAIITVVIAGSAPGAAETEIDLTPDSMLFSPSAPGVPVTADCVLESWAASWGSGAAPAGDWTATFWKRSPGGTFTAAETFDIRTS